MHFKVTLYYSSLRALWAARLLKYHFKKLCLFAQIFGILNGADIYGIDFDGDAILDFTPERNFLSKSQSAYCVTPFCCILI